MNTLKISLAPLAYYWPREKSLQFYADAMTWPLDTIYLGEVVCSRRHQLRLADWISIAKECREAGKEVVLSTLTLIDSDTDRRQMHKCIDAAYENGFIVEANDFSAVRTIHGLGQKFIAGPHLNVYHEGTLSWLHNLGAQRFVPPVELPRDELQVLQMHRPENMQTEIQVWGRMALAYSSRCFTARRHRLRKDSCEFSCEQYPDGLALKTREHSDFLTINGIQTQSAHCLDLGQHLPSIKKMGIEYVRLQPQSQHMAEVVQAFHVARHASEAEQHQALVADSFLPPQAERSNGYWLGKAGMKWETIPIHAV